MKTLTKANSSGNSKAIEKKRSEIKKAELELKTFSSKEFSPARKKLLTLLHGTNPTGEESASSQQGLIDFLASCQLTGACFAAGTKLWTESGWKSIEEIIAGEKVYSRSEWEPASVVELREVEEVFVRTGIVFHLHLQGGKTIRTTGEHPFYKYNTDWKGWEDGQPGEWVPASSLTTDDFVMTHDGAWLRVEEVFDTGEWELVYNLRVAEHHTYFVGEGVWAVWAHNVSCEEIVREVRAITGKAGDPKPFEDHWGLLSDIKDAMNAYLLDHKKTISSRDFAIKALQEAKGVGPVHAAQIFWNVVLKAGSHFKSEHGVELTKARTDLMRIALSRGETRIVLPRNSDYVLPSRGNHLTGDRYFTDDKGRIERVEFNLVKSDIGGMAVNDPVTTWAGAPLSGQTGDQGGHLVADQFRGTDAYPNLVPMSGNLNQESSYFSNTGGGWGRMEGIWYQALVKNLNVENIIITINYKKNGKEVQTDGKGVNIRPVSFDIDFTIRGRRFSLGFNNDGLALSSQQRADLEDVLAEVQKP